MTAVEDCHWTGVQPRVHRGAIGAGALCIVPLLLTTTNSLLLITPTCKLDSCLLQHCCGCHASASNVGRKLYADRRHPDVVPPQCYGPPSKAALPRSAWIHEFEYMHHSHTPQLGTAVSSGRCAKSPTTAFCWRMVLRARNIFSAQTPRLAS
jgi:hypothetical protein